MSADVLLARSPLSRFMLHASRFTLHRGEVMVETPDIERPPKELIDGLASIGSATASGELSRLGIRDPHIRGPVARTPGAAVVGPALTLQFMPKREDQYQVAEYAD